MAKRASLFSSDTALAELGRILKERRIDQGLSLGDVVEMTGFPKSTILNLENGTASNISYYIALGQAIQFSVLTSEINLELKSRFELSPERKNRKFLTLKVRALYKNQFFAQKRSVKNVLERLNEPNTNVKELSSKVSNILLIFVEDKILRIEEKLGRNNTYINNDVY